MGILDSAWVSFDSKLGGPPCGVWASWRQFGSDRFVNQEENLAVNGLPGAGLGEVRCRTVRTREDHI